MKYIIIILLVLSGCATKPPMPAPMKTPNDIITSTRGHDAEVKKDPN